MRETCFSKIPSFYIKNGSSDFLNKQRNLFDILDSAEKEKKSCDNSCNDSMDIDVNKSSSRRQRKITKQFRGQESLFNKPLSLPPRFKKRNKVPDFQRNPHKWTKYSLGDVTQNEMSNETNTAAAMSFLRDIEIQKLKTRVKMEVDDSNDCKSKPVCTNGHLFNLPTIKREIKKDCEPTLENSSETPKSVFKGTKFVMAEYVVGQNKKQCKKINKKNDNVEKGKEIFLNHIHEYEDE
ncbi:conserved hypothetical protein [Pediculus humanus corporis]|uniref:U5 small nuclear ribonucleoprotein TSSC4 n=1 Tax=Pediculus humanus subsp. corporis TaxID=121224 RepID=E0VYU9_PEDHC|nr:uncharacterized protein Phum_PHUM519460 [Pediculus humanus corporis]EEB18555.1 conserved hypothetical protein [Pediculus humanus corporis]